MRRYEARSPTALPATLLGGTLTRIGLLAVALGVAGSAVGLLASYRLNVASGATIIVTLALAFFLALLPRRR